MSTRGRACLVRRRHPRKTEGFLEGVRGICTAWLRFGGESGAALSSSLTLLRIFYFFVRC
ncbi:MAG TPA: hypothetical protein VLJ18_03780 [Thermoanaerobaculia bacterium]|nr:hypothetical protein [Thermoanaerobaculia bacterium]